MTAPDLIDQWLRALMARHTSALRRPEFLRAIRALSARYVESRAALQTRSPIDSAGKRAAFAAFYAPLHFFTTHAIVQALGLHRRPLRRIVDLGCGTGVAGAAWAAALGSPDVELQGIDANAWAASEATWSWRMLGLHGRARRGDLVRAAESLARERSAGPAAGIVLGWAVNELNPAARARLLGALLDLAGRGTTVLVIEPIARRPVPWWDDWSSAIVSTGGRADAWRLKTTLPAVLADLDEAAGFQRDELSARTLSAALGPGPDA